MDVPALSQLAGSVVPYLATAASAYGVTVVREVRDEAVDATVEASLGLGRRLLRRLLRVKASAASIETAMTDLAGSPDDADLIAALRVQIRKALSTDPELVADVSAMLKGMHVTITAVGERSIAVQSNSGIAATGDNATNVRGS